jgi:hypothetical protein
VSDAFDIFAEWSAQSAKDVPDVTEAKWKSFRAPYQVGWERLGRIAAERSGGSFSSAAYEFEPEVGDSVTDDGSDPVAKMFREYAWVEGAKRAVELKTGDLLDQEQFEFRMPTMMKGLSPWKVFKQDSTGRRRDYKNLTCRFGQELEVMESLPDLEGLCLNIWREPKGIDAARKVGSSDIRPFLELAAHVVPNAAEREHVFDFMAYTAQHQGTKINHALVLGSRVEGIGKDTLFEPLRRSIGQRYVREIGPPQLTASFNRWLVGCKLLIVQEMHNFERRATMNLLKPLVAAPPNALPVNLKGMQEFFVPNLLSTVFFTNEDDALAISNGDRRYFIAWNDGEPAPKAFYDGVWDWLRAGGVELAAAWLLQRDVSRFNARGRAPETEAKERMRKETRAPLAAWIEDGITDSETPFDRDLVLVDDIARAAPDYVRYKGQATTPQRASKALTRARAAVVTAKMRIPGVEGSRAIWALRRVDFYNQQADEILRALFLKQRDEANAREIKEAFS